MDLRRHCLLAALCALLPTASATAQPAPPAERVIRMSGAVPEAAGQQVAVHFALYDAESGGHQLWQETQTLSIDASGQFTAFLGATSLDGLPLETFATGAPRWLETSRPGGPAAPRTLLAAVPYAVVAATAANATTLAGRPASDFQLTAAARRRSNGPALDATATADLDPGSVNSGTVNYLGNPDNGVILASYIGSFLMAGAYLAIGSAISAVTKNQVIAFVISVVLCLLFVLAGYPIVQDLLPAGLPQAFYDTMRSFGFLPHFQSINTGVLDLRDITFFGSLIACALIINAIVLDMKKAS